MKKYNVDINHIIRHFDVNGKPCPKPYVDNAKWQDFKNKLTESEDLTMSQYEELKKSIDGLRSTVDKLANPMIYNYIDDNMPDWAKPTIQKLVDKGILKGSGNGLNLTEDLMRILVINDRAGIYD